MKSKFIALGIPRHGHQCREAAQKPRFLQLSEVQKESVDRSLGMTEIAITLTQEILLKKKTVYWYKLSDSVNIYIPP